MAVSSASMLPPRRRSTLPWETGVAVGGIVAVGVEVTVGVAVAWVGVGVTVGVGEAVAVAVGVGVREAALTIGMVEMSTRAWYQDPTWKAGWGRFGPFMSAPLIV